MPKLDDTRIVTFKEDYNPQRREEGGKVAVAGKVLYKKGQTYAIHYKLVEKIKKRGAKFDAEKLDVQKAIEKRKAMKKAA
jgi:hypothetical protein